MSDETSTRVALLELQLKQTQETNQALSSDVKEMKEALLRVLSHIDNTKDLREKVDELRVFMWKVLGIVGAVQVVGLPGVVYMLVHLAK